MTDVRGSTTSPEPQGSTLAELRARSAVAVAQDVQRPMTLDELVGLFPEDGPSSRMEMQVWLRARPELQTLVEGVLRGSDELGADPLGEERRLRAVAYVRVAARLFHTSLAPFRKLAYFVGITGSTAYGAPESGDDCDFFVVTRNGATWAFLGLVFLRLRLARLTGEGRGDPEWCFNYVVDDRSVRRDYAAPRGFLFAREALTVKPLIGDEYYRALLGSADWLRVEAPRLFAAWERPGLPDGARVAPTPGLGIRIFNALCFPWVAAYLQAVGLVRNARHRQARDGDSEFETVTRPGRMTFLVSKFDRLRGIYAPASTTHPESGPRSRAPGAAGPGPTGPASAPPPPPSEAPEGSGSLSG
jgi:hypothetical protein